MYFLELELDQAGSGESDLSPGSRGSLPGPLHLSAGGPRHGHPGAHLPSHRLHCVQLVQYYLANPHQGKNNYFVAGKAPVYFIIKYLEWCHLHTRDTGHCDWDGEGCH